MVSIYKIRLSICSTTLQKSSILIWMEPSAVCFFLVPFGFIKSHILNHNLCPHNGCGNMFSQPTVFYTCNMDISTIAGHMCSSIQIHTFTTHRFFSPFGVPAFGFLKVLARWNHSTWKWSRQNFSSQGLPSSRKQTFHHTYNFCTQAVLGVGSPWVVKCPKLNLKRPVRKKKCFYKYLVGKKGVEQTLSKCFGLQSSRLSRYGLMTSIQHPRHNFSYLAISNIWMIWSVFSFNMTT